AGLSVTFIEEISAKIYELDPLPRLVHMPTGIAMILLRAVILHLSRSNLISAVWRRSLSVQGTGHRKMVNGLKSRTETQATGDWDSESSLAPRLTACIGSPQSSSSTADVIYVLSTRYVDQDEDDGETKVPARAESCPERQRER
ncbi:4964_t:CDS:2, partial [Acaulospora colombiana]